MRTNLCLSIEPKMLARLDAEAERLGASRSYAVRRILAHALEIPVGALHAGTRIPAGRPRRGDAGEGGNWGPYARIPAHISIDEIENIIEVTMKIQEDANSRQRAARQREADAKDEAMRRSEAANRVAHDRTSERMADAEAAGADAGTER